MNAEVVTESESDNPEDYTHVSGPLTAEGKALIQKKRIAIRRKARANAQKRIAERRLLSSKVLVEFLRLVQTMAKLLKPL